MLDCKNYQITPVHDPVYGVIDGVSIVNDGRACAGRVYGQGTPQWTVVSIYVHNQPIPAPADWRTRIIVGRHETYYLTGERPGE
jgi:hypothetical protein